MTENVRFQWVSLQISQILSLERESDIRERLGKLPRGLKEAYDEIYSAICDSDGSKPVVAKRAFQYLLSTNHTLYSLNVSSLVSFVCQDPNSRRIQEVDIDVQFVLDACRNLLKANITPGHARPGDMVRFSHLSIQEYFESLWDTYECDKMVLKVSIGVLNDVWTDCDCPWTSGYDERFDRGEARTRRTFSEAQGFLIRHARYSVLKSIVNNYGTASGNTEFTTLLEEFIGYPSDIKPACKCWLYQITNYFFVIDFSGKLNPSPLHIACLLDAGSIHKPRWDPGSLLEKLSDTPLEFFLYLPVFKSLDLIEGVFQIPLNVDLNICFAKAISLRYLETIGTGTGMFLLKAKSRSDCYALPDWLSIVVRPVDSPVAVELEKMLLISSSTVRERGCLLPPDDQYPL